MYARIATFQGDPDKLEQAIKSVRGRIAAEPPPGLQGAKMLMLVDRVTGKGHGITIYDSEQAMLRGHEALDAVQGGEATRVAVEFFEVPVHKLA
jgi:hypothetical protein